MTRPIVLLASFLALAACAMRPTVPDSLRARWRPGACCAPA